MPQDNDTSLNERTKLAGQKSSKCKQATIKTNQSYIEESLGSSQACCSIEQQFKKEQTRKKERKKYFRHQWHATKHLTWNLGRLYNRSVI